MNTDPISLDGRLDENSWSEASVAKDFWQKSPRDDIKAALKTEVKLTYDRHFFYVGFTCYDSSRTHILQTQKRDETFWDSDGVAIVVDPFDEATNGLFFGINTSGAQTDALLGGGSGMDNWSDEWNNRWFAETAQHIGYWTAEFAIPFKTLRYDPQKLQWGINFVRSDAKGNELHVWAQVPRQFWPIDLGYTGHLIWDKNPPKAKSNISVIPYVSGSVNEEEEIGKENKLSTGADVKIAVSPSMNLDLTVNPDFSQVEVDEQVTNLTRFDIFFPERRNFFLENSDLFSSFGNPLIRPFFSRRIGLGDDGLPVPIQFGARLSGNLNDNLRIGLLDVHTGEKGDIDAQNYFMAAFSQRLLKRSSLSGFLINRQGFNGSKNIEKDYGRNAGLSFRYQSEDGKWDAWSVYHHSFKEGINSENKYTNFGASYTGKVLNAVVAFLDIGTNYYADVGFINRIFQYDASTDSEIRQGYKFLFFPIGATLIPEKTDVIQRVEFMTENYLVFDPDFNQNEANTGLFIESAFANSSSLLLQISTSKITLQYPFSFTDDTPLPIGDYSQTNYGLEYISDTRKLFNYSVGFSRGSFYSGTLRSLTLGTSYRRQPWGLFTVSAEYNDLKFPDPYGNSKLWLVGPKLEIAFTRDLFWSTFVQYNTQAENFNINSRLQWQFKPLSWVYLVYTDNYNSSVWTRKNRAIVLKINYWLSL